MKRILVLSAVALATGCAQPPATQTAAVTTPPQMTPVYQTTPQYQPPQPSAAVRDAQDELRTLGFYNGSVDGLAGPETTGAIERFQNAQGLAPTGRLDGDTARRLRNETAARNAAPPSAIQLGDAAAVEDLQGRLHRLGFYNE